MVFSHILHCSKLKYEALNILFIVIKVAPKEVKIKSLCSRRDEMKYRISGDPEIFCYNQA
jgi:hypothetical protein